MQAAKEGHLEVVKYLANNGANVNDKSGAGKFLILYLIVYRQLFSSLTWTYTHTKDTNDKL